MLGNFPLSFTLRHRDLSTERNSLCVFCVCSCDTLQDTCWAAHFHEGKCELALGPIPTAWRHAFSHLITKMGRDWVWNNRWRGAREALWFLFVVFRRVPVLKGTSPGMLKLLSILKLYSSTLFLSLLAAAWSNFIIIIYWLCNSTHNPLLS